MEVADTRIVSSICTVISSRARPDIVAWWLACLATKADDLGRIPGAPIFLVCFYFPILVF